MREFVLQNTKKTALHNFPHDCYDAYQQAPRSSLAMGNCM